MNVSSDKIAEIIAEILRCRFDVNNKGEYVFPLDSIDLPSVARDKMSSIADIINSFEEVDDSAVATETSFEVLVQSASSARAARISDGGLQIDDEHSGLSYSLGKASDAYTIYLWLRLTDANNRPPMRFFRSAFLARELSRRGQNEELSVFEVIRSVFRSYTLKIISREPLSTAAWKEYANAFFFHVGYNLDLPLMPDRIFNEFARPTKISNMRRSNIADLDVPRRRYVPDLVYHYQLAISADTPMLEYLSYYHVAEHWFENIYQDDLVEQIQLAITSPAFSYKRKKDLRDLIRKISKAVQLRNDELVINEQVALRLTLNRYVDLSELVADLRNFDASLLDYYSNHVVAFCGGDKVILEQGEDATTVFTALANRIYKTRNALVHSKEGLKGRFVPFSDDRELIPEVPLVRFIAEQIITASSVVPA